MGRMRAAAVLGALLLIAPAAAHAQAAALPDAAQPMFVVRQGSAEQRAAVAAWLDGLDLVSPPTREKIITAWVSAWTSSPHARLEDMPYTTQTPGYRLQQHVNDVLRVGLALAQVAERDWGVKIDREILVPILILHDVDKPLLFQRVGSKVEATALSRELPHGVIGGMLVRDLGFDARIVNAVTTHSQASPLHSPGVEGYILNYADVFSGDHAFMQNGLEPLYQKRR